jgi:ribosomal protein S18 acetylase RimI-like enzyme
VDYLIRNANVDDAEAIGAVVVRAWQAAYRGIMPDDYLDGLRAEQRAAMWRRLLADTGPDRWVRVLTVEDELVGFASCGPELADVSDGKTGELYAINLDPDHWGRGLGRALLADVTGGLADAGYHTAVLWVATRNERARRLYESQGWAAEGPPRDVEVFGVSVNEVRYRKRLGDTGGIAEKDSGEPAAFV